LHYVNAGVANSVKMFDLLASDALAAVGTLEQRGDIDPLRIGLLGVSQGGWIAPARGGDAKFVITV
jgi:uncharacterized protein